MSTPCREQSSANEQHEPDSPTMGTVLRAGAADHLSDQELVQRVREGDRWAEEALYHQYVGAVTGVATRLLGSRSDAEDVVQDTFVTAFEKIHQLADAEALKMWLLRIAVRYVHARFRRRAIRRKLGLDRGIDDAPLAELLGHAAPPEVRAELSLLDGAFQKMPSKERVAWMLRHVEGRSLREVSKLVGCSLATTKRRVAAANARVRAHLDVPGGGA